MGVTNHSVFTMTSRTLACFQFNRYIRLFMPQRGDVSDLGGRKMPCSIHTHQPRFFSTYYDSVDREATTLSSDVDSNYVVGLLKQFVASRHDSSVLSPLFSKNGAEKKDSFGVFEYLILLQTCKRLEVRDLDLVSPVSVNLRSALSRLLSDTNKKAAADHKGSVLAICRVYNDLRILYDPLFLTISQRFSNELEKFTWDEVALLLRTYSLQRYNDAEMVGKICERIEGKNLGRPEPSLLVSLYSSLANLEYLSPTLKARLEDGFVSSRGKFHSFHPTLRPEELLQVAYSNLLLDAPSINDLELVLSCIMRIAETSKGAEFTKGFLRNFTLVVSYMKCLHRDLYNLLDEETNRKVMEILERFTETKKFETSVFTEKVSEHLKRMRIRCDTNVYKNGVLLDIVEQDQNLVWLCNSYHRFYATTFNMTASSKLMSRLIRAFGYKVSTIQYYQWGRMKCKRTRFAFLRMARYYALKDKREYDPKYAGWSLPYIWWNYTARDRLHISHYDHYNP